MTEPARAWDRLPTETPIAHTAFLAYLALGARRSVREAAHQNNVKATSSSGKGTRPNTTIRRWLGWSARHKWVSRANARDAWLARVSDDQIVVNLKACMSALTTKALELLETGDSRDFLRAARALSLHFPPVQQVEDVSEPEPIESLSDLSDEQVEELRDLRDAQRAANAAKAQEATGQIHEQPKLGGNQDEKS